MSQDTQTPGNKTPKTSHKERKAIAIVKGVLTFTPML